MQEINVTSACLIKWWLSISLDTTAQWQWLHTYIDLCPHVRTINHVTLDIHNMHSMELNNIIIIHVCTCMRALNVGMVPFKMCTLFVVSVYAKAGN